VLEQSLARLEDEWKTVQQPVQVRKGASTLLHVHQVGVARPRLPRLQASSERAPERALGTQDEQPVHPDDEKEDADEARGQDPHGSRLS
jgi:hypothetical protein